LANALLNRDWERWLQNSGGPASTDEEAKRDRTEKRIRDAVRAAGITTSEARIYAKGSYANSTNVRLDSDVDICVEWQPTFAVARTGSAVGAAATELGYLPAATDFEPQAFRRTVERAMVKAFGTAAVDTTGSKAITVAAGPTTLDADVVPCRELHRYDAVGRTAHVGSRLYPRDGGQVDNWPKQHYDNGVAKIKRTGKRFKTIIRCLKRLENDMVDTGIIAKPVPGYLIECLVWNAPDSCFGNVALLSDLRAVFRAVWTPLSTDSGCGQWGEINELKYLFTSGQKWTRQEAFDFIDKAWDTVGVG
jgi:hypothetical protein